MTLLAALPNPPAAGQLALAAVLAAVGFVLLLPKPRVRSVMGGTAALVAAAAVAGLWAHTCFGDPAPDWGGQLLFVLFSTGAVGFGTVLVVQGQSFANVRSSYDVFEPSRLYSDRSLAPFSFTLDRFTAAYQPDGTPSSFDAKVRYQSAPGAPAHFPSTRPSAAPRPSWRK